MDVGRLLTVIPQFPLDPASGAAASIRTTCEMLAQAGWRVKVIATTGSESPDFVDALTVLGSLGIACRTDHPPLPSPGSVHHFVRRAVDYSLLDAGSTPINEARRSLSSSLDELVFREVAGGAPDVLLTFGSSEAEVQRRLMAKNAGSRIVFSLSNTAYRHARSFAGVDAIITPSRFLSEYYRVSHGVDSTPLPTPVWPGDVVASRREPVFFTFINPSLDKGLLFFLRLVQECSRRGLSVPFLVVESRGSAALLGQVARAIGLDLRATPNLQVVRSTSDPTRIYAVTKVLLAPSVWEEASGRVVVEAQLNGIPVIASNRGGLPETVGSGGYVLPVGGMPEKPESWEIGEAILNPWLELMDRLHTDDAFFQSASRAASEAAEVYRSGKAALRRIEFFRMVLSGEQPAPVVLENHTGP